MITSEESSKNLRSVIGRLIELIKHDLSELNQLLQYSDPFELKQKHDDVNLKRERCSTLLKVLQNALASEMKIDGKAAHIITSERSKAADKIMTLLRNHRFIESSELAEYLKQTIIASDIGVGTTCNEAELVDERRLPKSIKKLKKVYDRRRHDTSRKSC